MEERRGAMPTAVGIGTLMLKNLCRMSSRCRIDVITYTQSARKHSSGLDKMGHNYCWLMFFLKHFFHRIPRNLVKTPQIGLFKFEQHKPRVAPSRAASNRARSRDPRDGGLLL